MSEYSDVIVRVRHLDGLFCRKGARTLAAHLGFDWMDFVQNGVTADKLIATGDAMAIALAHVAIKENENGRQ